jgi:hypothetical protein
MPLPTESSESNGTRRLPLDFRRDLAAILVNVRAAYAPTNVVRRRLRTRDRLSLATAVAIVAAVLLRTAAALGESSDLVVAT